MLDNTSFFKDKFFYNKKSFAIDKNKEVGMKTRVKTARLQTTAVIGSTLKHVFQLIDFNRPPIDSYRKSKREY